jgi:hypothetical protein
MITETARELVMMKGIYLTFSCSPTLSLISKSIGSMQLKFFGFNGTAVWIQDFILARQAFYYLTHASSPVLLWLFWR